MVIPRYTLTLFTLRNNLSGPSDHPSIGDLACGRLHRCGERRQRRCGADGQTAGRQVADVGSLHLLRPPKNVEISPTILMWNWDVEPTKDVVFFLDDVDFMIGLFGFLLTIL